MPYFLIGFNLLLMTSGQLFFKKAAFFVNDNPNLSFVLKYLHNPWFYCAVAFFGLSTLVWVQILTNVKLSIAYPTLSITYILVAIGAFFFFGEKMIPVNILGLLLVMLGVSLISIK